MHRVYRAFRSHSAGGGFLRRPWVKSSPPPPALTVGVYTAAKAPRLRAKFRWLVVSAGRGVLGLTNFERSRAWTRRSHDFAQEWGRRRKPPPPRVPGKPRPCRTLPQLPSAMDGAAERNSEGRPAAPLPTSPIPPDRSGAVAERLRGAAPLRRSILRPFGARCAAMAELCSHGGRPHAWPGPSGRVCCRERGGREVTIFPAAVGYLTDSAIACGRPPASVPSWRDHTASYT